MSVSSVSPTMPTQYVPDTIPLRGVTVVCDDGMIVSKTPSEPLNFTVNASAGLKCKLEFLLQPDGPFAVAMTSPSATRPMPPTSIAPSPPPVPQPSQRQDLPLRTEEEVGAPRAEVGPFRPGQPDRAPPSSATARMARLAVFTLVRGRGPSPSAYDTFVNSRRCLAAAMPAFFRYDDVAFHEGDIAVTVQDELRSRM